MKILLLGLLTALLTGCETLAGMCGYVPVEVADGGPPATVVGGLGIEESVGITGAVVAVATIANNFYRNWTRAKALRGASST